jgi:hypothetical protein
MAQIGAWYERLLTAGGPFNIQLSGGEPCVRDDLPEIIRLGRSYGFTFFQLNTNGLRLARDAAYLQELKDAGLSTVFLQFDGTTDEVFRHIRGRALLQQKMAVIQRCEELEIGVVLVPTLVPGVNTAQIGEIIQLALAHTPTVRGVHFQPISYFGRYDLHGKSQAPANADRITIPEVIRAIESQTDGLLPAAAFCPPGGENALCSFHANFVQMPDGSLKALTRHIIHTPVVDKVNTPVVDKVNTPLVDKVNTPLVDIIHAPLVDKVHVPLVDLTLPLMGTMPSLNLDLLIQTLPQAPGGCCGLPANNEKPVEAALGAARSREFVAENWSAPGARPQAAPASGPSFGEWDVFLERKRTHTFCVSGMAFQDAWTLDLERLRDCYIHTASPDGRLVPFCAYNLTDSQGRSLYRRADETFSA